MIGGRQSGYFSIFIVHCKKLKGSRTNQSKIFEKSDFSLYCIADGKYCDRWVGGV